MAKKRKKKKQSVTRRVIKWGALLLVLFLVAGVVVLRVQYNGPALARFVEAQVNDRIRGRVEIDNIQWPLGSLHEVVSGGWIPVDAYGLKVYDYYGRKIVEANHARAEIHTHSVIFGQHDVVLRKIQVLDGGYARIRRVQEPYPMHEYDWYVVSLISAFYAKDAPSFWAGLSAAPGRVYDLEDYHVDGIILDVEYPGFDARLWGVRGSGFLISDSSLPLAKKLSFGLAPRADNGMVVIGADRVRPADLEKANPLSYKAYRALSPFPLDDEILVGGHSIFLKDIEVAELKQIARGWPRDPTAHDVDFALTATTSDGARVAFEGKLDDYWGNYFGGDYDVKMTVLHAGPLVHKMSNQLASGDELELRVGVTGPSLGPKIGARLEKLDLAVPVSEEGPPLDLHLASCEVTFDLATEEGELKDTVAQGEGGELQMAATFGLKPYHFDLNVDITQPIRVGPYLPRDVRLLAGTQLRGHLHAHGTGEVQQIDDLDLWLGRAHLEGKLVHEKGSVVHANRLRARLGQTGLSARGWVDFDSDEFDLFIKFGSKDAARYLRHFGAPTLARGIDGEARVEGEFTDPRATAFMTATGVPVVQRLNAKLAYRDQLISVLDASTHKLGGSISGKGRVRIGANPRVLGFDASARNLDLAKIPVFGAVLEGMVNADVHAAGPTRHIRADADARIRDLNIAGDEYEDFTLTGKMEPDGTQSVELHVNRKAGGRLDIIAAIARDDSLSGVVTLRDVPVDSFDLLGGPDRSPIGGKVSTDLRLAGTAEAPTLDGTFSLDQAWFGDTFLGSAELQLDRVGEGKMRLHGHVFQGMARVEGTIDTKTRGYPAVLSLRVRRLELDQFFPEFAKKLGARGWITGEIAIETNLLAAPNEEPKVALKLTEAMVLIDNEDTKGRPAPVRMRNRTPLSIVYDGTTARIEEAAIFSGPAGDFTLSGWARRDQLALNVTGDIAVKLLEPYLREYFDEMKGTLTATIDVGGTLDSYAVTGTIDIDQVSVRPAGQEAIVSIPSGKVQVTNDQIAVTGVTIHMDDAFSVEHAELTVRGGIKMKDFEPTIWALQLDGELAGKMLLVAAPKAFSAASGLADLSISLHGFGAVPNIDGTLRFDSARPLALSPRGVGHEIAFTRGTVTFTDQLIELERVRGWIDDEGRLTDVTGEISLEDWQPVDVDVMVSATTLPFRVAEQLDLTLNVHNLNVIGGEETGLDITGTVEIVDGRYLRDFNLVTDVLTPERTEESSDPFYSEMPILADARLGLRLETRAFFVKNNVADIELNGTIAVSGTVADPKLDGEVLVEEGSFKFPTMRAEFTRTWGSVSFSRQRKFPDETPVLNLQSESDYRDTRGQEHLITLTLKGTLNNLNWDLFTSSGLNKSQSVSLLFMGRTTEELRESLGDEPISKDPSQLDRTPTEGKVYDELVKDLAGDFISLLIEDKLRDFTKLDVARLEIGTSSVGFHVEKDLFKNLRILADWERDLRESTFDLRGELRLMERLFFEGELLDRNFDDDSEEDISRGLLRLVWRKLSP